MQTTETLPEQDFMTSKWRPMMAVMYMIVCTCDFVLFPVLWSVLQAVNHGQISTQWQPITLQGAGLFHMAMGAVLGVAAWSRGQEKIAGVATIPAPVAPAPAVAAPAAPVPVLAKPQPAPQQEL